jgi:hypothetical protein
MRFFASRRKQQPARSDPLPPLPDPFEDDIYAGRFPHCDSNVLHAPGECDHCDHYPEAQDARMRGGINFTGHGLDPATAKRPLETINRWGGNIPKKGPVIGYDWAGYEVTDPT